MHFFFKIFGHIKKKQYLCTRFRKGSTTYDHQVRQFSWLEYMPVTHGVAGSSPVRTARSNPQGLLLLLYYPTIIGSYCLCCTAHFIRNFTRVFGVFCTIDFAKTRKTCYKTYFFVKKFGRYIKKQYLCTVFFMVLDLRLSKGLGCREDNPSFFYMFSHLF